MLFGDTSLTFTLKAKTQSPEALMLRAALMSRPCRVEQDGQIHSRSPQLRVSSSVPQQEQGLEPLKKGSTASKLRPTQCRVFPSILKLLPQPTSALCLLRTELRVMFLTFRDSRIEPTFLGAFSGSHDRGHSACHLL